MPGHPPPLHLRGTVLPDGGVSDLWLVDGRISTTAVPGARTLVEGGWLLPGLVDAHCHVGLEATGAVGPERAEAHARTERDAGVLLLRDAGSPADTRWIDQRPDLPRIIRAGRHLARPRRYLPGFAEEVEPEDLRAAVEHQAAVGDGWIKLVGDWIDREVGDLTPLWPVEVAAEAIQRAHQLGCRVTAHVFSARACAELVAAGVDCLEHGTGAEPDVLAQMAERGVALVPTMLQVRNFPTFAAQGRPRYPRYAAHMERLFAGHREVLANAVRAGVAVYAGTDAGGYLPHGQIAAEVALLSEVLGAPAAVAAASWSAREWLGHPGLEPGAPADLLVLDADPRLDVGVLARPRHVVLAGEVVTGRAR